jgi:hypothetical protein
MYNLKTNKIMSKNILVAQAGKRKKVWVIMEEDTFPNKGGYFCQVYHDPDCTMPTDMCFTIQSTLLRSCADKLKMAQKLASDKVKNYFYVR